MNTYTLSDLVFIDVETTGLDDQIDRVIEVAATRVPFNPEKWDKPISSICLRFMPDQEEIKRGQEAFKVNGFSETHPDWADAPSTNSIEAKDAWLKLIPLLRKATLVSQNVPFDRGFILKELKHHGLIYHHAQWGFLPPWERRFIDIQSYSFFISMEKSMGKWGLQEVYKELQLPVLKAHRAEADVQRGMAVMKHVWDRFINHFPPTT